MLPRIPSGSQPQSEAPLASGAPAQKSGANALGAGLARQGREAPRPRADVEAAIWQMRERLTGAEPGRGRELAARFSAGRRAEGRGEEPSPALVEDADQIDEDTPILALRSPRPLRQPRAARMLRADLPRAGRAPARPAAHQLRPELRPAEWGGEGPEFKALLEADRLVMHALILLRQGEPGAVDRNGSLPADVGLLLRQAAREIVRALKNHPARTELERHSAQSLRDFAEHAPEARHSWEQTLQGLRSHLEVLGRSWSGDGGGAQVAARGLPSLAVPGPAVPAPEAELRLKLALTGLFVLPLLVGGLLYAALG